MHSSLVQKTSPLVKLYSSRSSLPYSDFEWVENLNARTEKNFLEKIMKLEEDDEYMYIVDVDLK